MWAGGDRVRNRKTGYNLLKPAIELLKGKVQLSEKEIKLFDCLCRKVCFKEPSVIDATKSVYKFMIENTEEKEKKDQYQAVLASSSYFAILLENRDGSLYGPDFRNFY